MANNRRPQTPKRRNFVAKNVHKVHRPQTFRDRTKYDRYEDYLQDQLDDYVNGEWDELDEEEETRLKEEFKAKLTGKKYDPDQKKNWDDYRWEQGNAHVDELIERMTKEIREATDRQIMEQLKNED